MFYLVDTEQEENTDKTDNHLVLDGTVNLDYSDDEPRVKGLIELLSWYYGDKPNQNP